VSAIRDTIANGRGNTIGEAVAFEDGREKIKAAITFSEALDGAASPGTNPKMQRVGCLSTIRHVRITQRVLIGFSKTIERQRTTIMGEADLRRQRRCHRREISLPRDPGRLDLMAFLNCRPEQASQRHEVREESGSIMSTSKRFYR